jgi:hypothetical protein
MTDYDNYVDLYAAKMPYWLYGPQGEAWATAWGTLLDGIHDAAVQAVKCRMPLIAPADAVPVIANERNFDRVPRETIAQFRERVHNAWEAWRWAGTDKGIVDQLELTGLSAVVVRNNQWVWDSNSGNVANYWARFWVVVSAPQWSPDDTWGSGTWGDGGLWGFDATVTDADIKYVNKTIVKWKHAPTQCVHAIVVMDGGLWGYPIDDTWGSGTWGGSAAYLCPETE